MTASHPSRRGALTTLAGLPFALAALPRAAQGAARPTAMALQIACDAVNQDSNPESARERMMASIARTRANVLAAKGFVRTFNGTEVKLVVLPEYHLTGFPLGETYDQWKAKAALDQKGPEYDAMAEIAQTADIYLCLNAYETDPAFPDLYFQANVIWAPSGEVVLRYRRMISLYTPTPYDVWDAYLDTYGLDAVFPVAETPVGRLATIASEEILYPEIARAHALRGAEVFCHPTSEVGAVMATPKDIAKRARAIENLAYVVSANSAAIDGTPIPAESTTGLSKIVDYKGSVLAEAHGGESIVAHSPLDLDGLRATRQRAGMHNLLARTPLAAFRAEAERTELSRPNGLIADGAVQRPDRAAYLEKLRGDIGRLAETGVLAAP